MTLQGLVRNVIFAGGLCTLGGCALFAWDEAGPGPETESQVVVVPVESCSDLWKHYSDEARLITDDQVEWRAHDDRAVLYLGQFGGSCNAADTRDAAASDLRCKALWDVYLKEVGQMTKDDRTWRDHDIQQSEVMNRIRSSCEKTACTLLPGIRCNAPKSAMP
ncbi:hypothetical protein W02_40950 [Nitrospira sp. KM1]|uniref:hypothetical protein n=1 Tax=Nitrospira sp. KM1 TaxID=1936990 RepID=UPI0013A7A70F|nr:hypothetical protein [Nitrospira sp. KM1]BCA56955.1 hypothetical protein W02_40950 [Nitrospira sp. KM1]